MGVVIDKILRKPLLHSHTVELDNHYLVKAGITGGQTAIGGTGVTDILKLQGTSGNGTSTSPAIQALVGNNGGTTALTLLNNGNVGIGSVTPDEALDVTGNIKTSGRLSVGTSALNSNFVIEALSTETAISGEKRALSFAIKGNPSADWGSTSILGLNGFAEHIADYNALGSYFGAFFGARNSGPSTLWVSYGGFLEVQNTSTGTCDYAAAIVASCKDTGGGNFTTAYGLIAQSEVAASGTIGTWYGALIKNPTGGGIVTTNYGLYIESQSKATTNYAIYTNDGAIRLGGDIGFHGTAPISKPTVSGDKEGNAALGSLITALANYGLIVDSTT